MYNDEDPTDIALDKIGADLMEDLARYCTVVPAMSYSIRYALDAAQDLGFYAGFGDGINDGARSEAFDRDRNSIRGRSRLVGEWIEHGDFDGSRLAALRFVLTGYHPRIRGSIASRKGR